uniref:Uncharacterized protein n=1 Tax=Strongyloides papillosus TaxID=174720 RepID=A0A0N5BG98_STREA
MVHKKNNDNKIRFNFKSKPFFKSLNLDKNQKTNIPNETMEDYLTDLFNEEDTKDNGLLRQWLNETQFEQQNIVNIWNEELFENELKYSKRWKAAGLNGIYLALYKQLPSAKMFLKNWCLGVLKGLLTNTKKCTYSLSEILNSSQLEEIAYADYNELKATYKYLGIDEDQYGYNMEENVERIYEAIEKFLNLVFSIPLFIGDMIKAINTCILPKVSYIFSHQGEPTLRNKIAQKIDLIIPNIYGLKIEYEEDHLIIKDIIFESEKKCNKYIVESIDKVDEPYWLTEYSKNRTYPATVVSQKLFTLGHGIMFYHQNCITI